MEYDYYGHNVFRALIGQTIKAIEVKKEDGSEEATEIRFALEDGRIIIQNHQQDCCEYVRLHDIVGDLEDLIDNPLLVAEVSTNTEDTTGIEYPDSFTWTYYKLATIKGHVDFRWLGESNGYYSEEVSTFVMEKNDAA